MNKADIGVLGGSGFYSLMKKAKEIKIETPYGPPSGKISLGEISGRKVAFLPRHSKTHDLPPHRIPYRANIYALKSLGVKRIITVTAAGSLQANIKPGDFVVLDQFIDRTKGREDTLFHGPITTHISAAYPYCSQLSKLAFKCGGNLGIKIHPKGTVVVIQGPRFSTAAESEWFTKMGWHVVNMTQYPEVILAREMELCYTAIALITDYDVGFVSQKKVKPVSVGEFSKVFKKNNEKALKLVYKIIEKMPKKRTCQCMQSLNGARVES
ncbi:S-methyl-5'-thioadenosine phosphorylase [Candidatus Microgenomates bacterium]|nr:S-methyl-5'-thioadenosine phosphorylase [Candidatus Microgenomates bacterium]